MGEPGQNRVGTLGTVGLCRRVHWGAVRVSDYAVRANSKRNQWASGRLARCTKGYLRYSAIADVCCAYDVRFIGTVSDEFRKVLNAGVILPAVLFKLRKDPRISALGAACSTQASGQTWVDQPADSAETVSALPRGAGAYIGRRNQWN
jgi:hypothetical protein